MDEGGGAGRPWVRRAWMLAAIAFVFGAACACRREPDVMIEHRRLKVGCGRCLFGMDDRPGCFWAAEVDGKHYVMQGALPANHASHAPDGMCRMLRTAVVDGRLREGRIIVTHMELLPAPEAR